jgi:N-acetyl-anhydromuramoyl-L-alanine amidase
MPDRPLKRRRTASGRARKARGRPPELAVDGDGWLAPAQRIVSPNCDERPAGTRIELLLIHNISLPPGEFGTGRVEQLFTNRLPCDAHPYFAALQELRVSAHFLIARDGQLTQFVGCKQRAWHAGISEFEGRNACNDFSLGVEMEGTDELAYTEEQYRMLARLTRALLAAFPVRALRGHGDVAPGRKTDPGPSFDWNRLARDLGCDPALFAPGRLG